MILPVFDERDNLAPLAREIGRAMAAVGASYEVVWIDDGSTDGSLEEMRKLAAGEPRMRILRHERNAGLSAALDTGFRHARGEVWITMDTDLQHDPADVPMLLDALEHADVVCGVRSTRQDSPLRRVSSRIANGVRNALTGESIRDVGCTLRAYRAEFVRRVPMFSGMHRFLPTLLRWEGARIVEIPVRHRPRRSGRSKYNVRNRIGNACADLLAVRWMRRRRLDRRDVEEVPAWTRASSGWPSASPDRPSSSRASSSSGSPPNEGSGASSRASSGS